MTSQSASQSAAKSVFQDFVQINRKGFYEDQARITFPNGEDTLNLEVILTPKYGPFRGGQLAFKMQLPASYPNGKPTVKCLTKVYHPNISFDGNICFSMFSTEWNNGYRLEHYINGLLWLLQNPNPDSALNGQCVEKDLQKYEQNVRIALGGGMVNNVTFPKAFAENYEPPGFENLPLFFSYVFSRLHMMSCSFEELFTEDFSHLLPKTNSILSLIKEKGLQGQVVHMGASAYTVKQRTKRLRVESRLVLKELVWQVGEQIVLVVTNDYTLVDVKRLAECFGVSPTSCKLLPEKDIEAKILWKKTAVPAFGHKKEKVAATIISQRIFELPEIFCSSGSPSHIFRMSPSELKKALSDSEVKVVDDISERLIKLHNFDWQTLPSEIISYLFTFLSAKDLGLSASVCKGWGNAAGLVKKTLQSNALQQRQQQPITAPEQGLQMTSPQQPQKETVATVAADMKKSQEIAVEPQPVGMFATS